MWLIIAAICALIATFAWIKNPTKNRYGYLSMAFWALTAMIFVDHVIGWFLEGAEGDFLEISMEAFILSLCMVIPIFAVWELVLVLDTLGVKKNALTTEKTTEEVQ